jgi:uncharacterized RDD family membrane protein YckC
VNQYAGLATRTVAFAVDALVINVVAWTVGAVVALGLSVIDVPDGVVTALAAIGAVVAIAWCFLYFVFFWSTSGQTPGSRALGICVESARTGQPVSAGRAVLRVLALPLAALPLCAGFLMILVERRRRGLHDLIAGTVVVYAPKDPRSGRVVHVAQFEAEEHLRRAQDDEQGAVESGHDANGHVRPDEQRDADREREHSA